MKTILFVGVLLVLSTFAAQAQEPDPYPTPNDPEKTPTPVSKDPSITNKGAGTQYVRPDRDTRFNRYVKSMFGPVAIGRKVASAGYGTWQNSPQEWGPHWDGFGKRFASSMGKGIIKQTVTYGLDEALKLDSSFYRSRKRDAGSRVTNALLSTVTARNKRGKRVMGIPRLAGSYTAGVVAAETWYPRRYTWKDGVKSSTISLGMSAAFNLFREFVMKK